MKTPIERLMRLAKNDVLVAAFVIDAVAKLAELVNTYDPKKFENGLITYECWNGAGQRALAALDGK